MTETDRPFSPLAVALRRLYAAQLLLVFGRPEARRDVEALLDKRLSPEAAEAVRSRLDRVADVRLSGSRSGSGR